MNGYSEASIVCGGNIGDPGFYLYLAKVKQKLQKILKTDREDLLIEKVERWNSVRVTFRLPPTSADILRSLAEQRPEALRNLGIQSVQVDAGRLVSLGAAARSGDSSAVIAASAHSSSTTGVNWNQSNVDRSTLVNAASSGGSGGSGGLLLALVEASNSSGDEVDNGQRQLERKRSSIDQSQQQPSIMAAKGNPPQQPAASSVQQQNLLGYLLEEPDQPTPPAPPPYQDYNQQQHQVGLASGSFPPHVQQQQRWQQPQQPNTVVLAWNHHAPPTHSSASVAPSQTMSEYYFHGHQQQAPHPSVATPHQHQQYPNAANSTSAMHSRQQHESAAAMGYSSGTNNNPAFHNVNYGHQQLQPNPGNVSNSPLLVGLLQQNSPPPQSSSSFMQPSTTPLLRNNNTGNLSGYNNELVADSSPPAWMSVAATQGSVEPATKKQKRASAPKPKKAPNPAKSSTAKKTASKRAGANVTSDGNSLDPSYSASSSAAPIVDQDLDNQQHQSTNDASSIPGTPSSSFNRDTSISSVIDSVLCNVAMGAVSSDCATTTEMTNEAKSRQSLESPSVQAKSTPSSAGPIPGLADETASQCCSSPMSAASVSTIAQHQHLANATGSPVQNPQQRQQQSVLRSVSSSSSSSSPLVAAASPTFDPQWHQRPGGVTVGSMGGGIPPYSAYQNQPNHQFVRHQHYPQHQETDLGVARIRRQAVPRQPPPRFAQASPVMNRFQHPGLPNAPGHSYPPQTTYDLAHHDNASRIDSNAYSSTSIQLNAGKARSPAMASVNGDMYLPSPHPAAAAAPRHPLYHGQQEQYGASSSWPGSGGDNGGNGSGAVAETSGYMISPKATPTVTSSGYGGADHDYLVAPSMESGGPASSFTFASDQQQPPVANEYYGFTSTASQQHGMYSYSTVTSRAGGAPMTPSFYNGGGDGQQMQEALVARHAPAYDHQQSTSHWEKQQQRVARHRQSWTLQQNYEQRGVYDDESMMRDMTGSVGSSPLDGFPSSQQPQQSMVSTASAQQHLHNHSLSMQQQQQQQSSVIDDPMLSGQVPAR